MDNNTKISSKKYKTIGDLLQAPILSIILVSVKQKDSNIKSYLFEWLYQNHYSKIIMSGNLTNRIKNISNQTCYYYIIKNVFNNIDILQNNKQIKQLLNNDCKIFIKSLHNIQCSLTGIFIDYLVRRIICEKTNKLFYDTRAEGNIAIDDKEFIFTKLPITMNDSYIYTKDTTLYKTKNILLEIFITSLSHTFAFGETPNQEQVNKIIHLLQNTPNIIELFYTPIEEVCAELLKNETDILLNQVLGYQIPLLNNKIIPSDCDLVINDVLYDIKCTSKDNFIYEILQLLGYASLLGCIPKINKKINNISVINLLQGYMTIYDISHITIEQMINYLKILVR